MLLNSWKIFLPDVLLTHWHHPTYNCHQVVCSSSPPLCLHRWAKDMEWWSIAVQVLWLSQEPSALHEELCTLLHRQCCAFGQPLFTPAEAPSMTLCERLSLDSAIVHQVSTFSHSRSSDRASDSYWKGGGEGSVPVTQFCVGPSCLHCWGGLPYTMESRGPDIEQQLRFIHYTGLRLVCLQTQYISSGNLGTVLETIQHSQLWPWSNIRVLHLGYWLAVWGSPVHSTKQE